MEPMEDLPPQLARLWKACRTEPADPVPAPSDGDFLLQLADALRLGLAFRHREALRPTHRPRVLHTEGVVGVVDWRPVEADPPAGGGIFAGPAVALARLSGTPEPRILDQPCPSPDNDFLIGAALKLEPAPDGAPRDLLFVSSPNGLPRPQFFEGERVLQTRTESASGCVGSTRVTAEGHFEEAVASLGARGFPRPPDHLSLPLEPLVGGPTPYRALWLRPARSRRIEADEDFRRILIEELRAGDPLYAVVGVLGDGSERTLARIRLREPFRASPWADRKLFFTHPGLPPDPPPGGDFDRPHAFARPVDHAALHALRTGSPVPRVVLRAEVILWLAERRTYREVARISGCPPRDVAAVARRWDERGAEGLEDDGPVGCDPTHLGPPAELPPEAREALRARVIRALERGTPRNAGDRTLLRAFVEALAGP
jgi:hypothetical protein